MKKPVVVFLSLLVLVSSTLIIHPNAMEAKSGKTPQDSLLQKNSKAFDPQTFDTLKTTKSSILELLVNGSLPSEYNGKYMAMTTSSEPLGDEFLPALNLGKRYLHFVSDNGVRQLKEAVMDPNVLSIVLDKRVDSTEMKEISPKMSNEYFQDVSNTQKVNKELNITGSGVTIGITDTGVDFGNSELSSAMKTLPSGISASFDASGSGLGMTNLTVQAQTVDGVTFLPLEGKSLIFWGADQQQFINSTSVGIQMRNLEITGIAEKSKSGNYKVGIAYAPFFTETQISNYFIFVLVDTTITGRYDRLYIDMGTSLGISLALNNIIFESGNLYRQLVDWSLNNDLEYGENNPILAFDWDGDGVNDFSLGSLSTTLDLNGIVNQGLVRGIDPLGRGFAYLNDAVGHGTMTASATAGRGVVKFPVYDDPTTPTVENSTLYTIPGSAPDAMVISTKGYQLTDFLLGWLWISGLEPDITGWKVNKDHLVDISSNSWGDGAHTSELKSEDFYSFFLDALSTPNIYDTLGATFDVTYSDYPGIMFVVSMGNGGPGFGTIASPGAASLAFTVGASTSFLEFGMKQRDDIALFSGEGPTPLGYVKPDASALGSFGFVTQPLIAAYGNGTYSSRVFGGTSEAGPRAAGIAALLYESLEKEGRNPNLGLVRTILKSTAKDMGFDPITQGAGLLDAYSAVTSVLGGDQIIVEDMASPKLIGERLNNAFNLFLGIDHPLVTDPVPDASLMVDSESLNLGHEINLVYGNGSQVNLTNVQIGMSYLYQTSNSSVSFQSKSNYNISTQVNANIQQSSVLLEVITSLEKSSYEQLQLAGLQPPELRLVNLNSGEYVAEAYTTAYSTVLYSGFPYNDFGSNLGFRLIDPGFQNSVAGWKPLQYTASILQYERVNWNLGVFQESGGKLVLSGNYSSDYRNGYVTFGNTMVPLTFSNLLKVGFMDSAQFFGEQNDDKFFYELDETAPSWNWLGSTARVEAGDHRFYYLSVPDNATFLAISVQWDENPMLPNLYLYDTNGTTYATSDVTYLGSGLYTGTTSTSNSQNMIIPTSGGKYVLETHVTETPFDSRPLTMRVLARYLTVDELPAPKPQFSQDIDGVISGDLSIDSSNYSVAQLPEIEVSKTNLAVYQESNSTLSRTMSVGDLQEGVDTPELEIVHDFKQGEKVEILLNWTANSDADLDIKVVLDGVDILNGLGTTPGYNEEHVFFGVKKAGTYTIQIDYVNGTVSSDITVNLSIDSRFGPEFYNDSPKLTIKSDLFPDDFYIFHLTISTNFGVKFVIDYVVFLANHTPFSVNITSPLANTLLQGSVNLAWSATADVRTSITLRHENLLYTVANDILSNSYTLDTTQYPNGDIVLTFTFTDGFNTVTKNLQVTISNEKTNTLPPLSSSTSSKPISLEFYAIFIGLLYLGFKKRHRNRRD